jgi:hypothetical protein
MLKIIKLIFWLVILFSILLLIGMIGFRFIVNLPWIDSFQNSTFYMSGLGPVAKMETNGQKIFSGAYAIFSGTVYLGITAYLLGQFFNLEFLQ